MNSEGPGAHGGLHSAGAETTGGRIIIGGRLRRVLAQRWRADGEPAITEPELPAQQPPGAEAARPTLRASPWRQAQRGRASHGVLHAAAVAMWRSERER